MKLLFSERDAFWWAYFSIMSKLSGKGHCGFTVLGKNTWLQFYIKNKSILSMLWDLLSNVLCILHGLLHWTKQKMMKMVLPTFPCYRWGNWGIEALIKLVVS